MEQENKLKTPLSLKIVAALILLYGISEALGVIIGIFTGVLSLNLNVIFIFVGYYLFKLSNTARVIALVFSWMEAIILPLFTFLAVFKATPLELQVAGQKVLQFPAWCAPLAAGVFGIFVLWKLTILRRPDIRKMCKAATLEGLTKILSKKPDRDVPFYPYY